MASCKECKYFEDCKKLGEKHWEDDVYPEDVNNVEDLCGGFEYNAEREKDMTSCKDCANGEVCGDVMEEHAEKCEVYVNKLAEAAKAKTRTLSVDVPLEGQWGKATETEETTLKIKAAGYDVIKEIVDEQHKIGFSHESAMDIISGAILMEEAVIKALI